MAAAAERLSITQAAARAGRCEMSIRRWIEAGRLAEYRDRGRLYVLQSDLDRLLASLAVAPPAALDLGNLGMGGPQF
jgi:hypothetical protein